MLDLLFLGTCASIPTKDRNPSATLVTLGGHKFLIDMGEGTQRQMKIAGVGMKGLRDILLTHHHPDHVFGLGGLFFTIIQVPPPKPITIHGNAKTLEVVDTLARLVWNSAEEREEMIRYRELPIAESMVWENRAMTVRAFPVQHGRNDSFGFSFEEKTCRPLLVEKVQALGVPQGPLWGQLKDGETVTLENGKIVDPDDVLGPEKPGAKFVYVGDCGFDEKLIDYAQGADCLVLEATFITEDEPLAVDYGHLSGRQAATVAKEAGVKTLFVNHRSQRYTDAQIYEDARPIFSEVIVATDFYRHQVKSGC